MNFFVFVLFFVSGASGLIYEVVWSRMMMLIFGRNVLAVGTVLAAFMSGLALGSYLLGRYADRSRNPLRLYALYEVGAGLTAFAASFLLTRITPLYVLVNEALRGMPVALALARFVIAFVMLIIPTVLMGATLPVLSRVVVKRLSRVGHELGRLYAVNTVGAVAGSLAAGFYLIGRLGLHGTIDVAVFGNMAVGASAWFMSSLPRFSTAAPEKSSPADPVSELQISDTQASMVRRMVLWSFSLSGLASFAYEIFWTRSLVFLLGNTTYSFTLMLTAFLSGIALGGYGIRFLADRVRSPLRLFAVIEIMIGAFSAVALPLLFFIARSGAVRLFLERMSGGLWPLALSNFGIALVLMLVPATLIGATLPLVGRIFLSDLRSTGTTVGKIYAVNTVGNVVGALLPGLLIMPVMGIQKGILLMAGLNAGLGIVLLFSRLKRATSVIAATSAAFLVLVLVLPALPISFQFPSEYQKPRDEVLYYKEGGLVTTKVWSSADTGYKVISVDGINIGGTSDSDYKQQILAHLPKLLLKSYRSELSVGLGSGILIGESGRHPALRKIDCVEISKGVVEGARYFSKENFDILADPRVNVFVDDIADFLRTEKYRYDIISADEKTAGKYASNSFSYSREYYNLLKERLAPGGLVIQWVPADLPPSQYELVVRTFLGGFPHVLLWYFPPVGSFTMPNAFLVGSEERIDIDPSWMRQVMETDRASFQGLRKYGLTTAESVLSHFIGNEETLRRAVPRGPVNSFEEPYFEFYSPRDYAVPAAERALADHQLVMTMRGPDFERLAGGSSGPEADRLNAAFNSEGIFLEGHGTVLGGRPAAEVNQYFEKAVAAAGWDANLRNEVLSDLYSESRERYFSGDYAGAMSLIRRAAEVYPESSEVHNDYGQMLWKMGLPDAALGELQRALELNPGFVAARRALASLYASRGEVNKSMEQWKEALSLDPGNVPVLVGYGIFLARMRDNTDALDCVRKAYRLDPEDPDVIDGYARVQYIAGNLAEARRAVLRGGGYYKGNPFFEQLRSAILGGN